jgi:hypothetical protein
VIEAPRNSRAYQQTRAHMGGGPLICLNSRLFRKKVPS